jgi:hypothetical protein
MNAQSNLFFLNSLSLSLSLSLSQSLIACHEYSLIFFAPKPTQRAFIAISDQRKINEKRCTDNFKQYNTSVSGVVSLFLFFYWGGGGAARGSG